MSHEIAWVEGEAPDWRNALGFFAREIMQDMHLVTGYDILFGKLRDFVGTRLFGETVHLDEPAVVKNLSEPEATKAIIETFKREINRLTVEDTGGAVEVRRYIRASDMKPFVAKQQEYLLSKKSILGRFVGDSSLEYAFARFLDGCEDIVSYVKNHDALGFKIEYRTAEGGIAGYVPDFLVKVDPKTIYVIETKGREDVEDPGKIARLAQWCADATAAQKRFRYEMLYVREEVWEKYPVKSFTELVRVHIGEKPKG